MNQENNNLWWAIVPATEVVSTYFTPLTKEWCEHMVLILRKKETTTPEEWLKKNYATVTSGNICGNAQYGNLHRSEVTNYQGEVFALYFVNVDQLIPRETTFGKLKLSLPYSKLKLEMCRIVRSTIRSRYIKENLSKSTQEWMDKFK